VEGETAHAPQDTWDWWNRFRLMANSSSKINLCLVVSDELPAETEVLRRLGEPIKTVSVPTSLFLTNKEGYPVLARHHQMLIRRFVHLDIQIIVRGPARGHDVKHFQQYLEHLYQQVPLGDPLQQFARGYEDYLQCPLQPLMDNLESQTYEVFEKDPVKYSEYQAAMMQALTDMVPEAELESRVVTLMVVGAGRGPLVRAALNASQNSGRKIRVFAVEKNPNAVVTLQQQQLEDWGDKVTVISSDMRDWNPPEEDFADILVSELLGSFGDNELSPECLDGAQKFLKPGGISIPCSYTSFLGPLQSSKLYNEVRQCKDETKHPLANFETPYVVHFQVMGDL
jgi:protein arginine N-methyltransferase 5